MDSVSSIPLSVGQEAMWTAWRTEPETPVHILPIPFQVHGTLDMPRLRAAVHALDAAYPHLRGRIQRTPDGPLLTWTDAPRIPVAERSISLGRDEAVRQAWQRPFDLEAGPLARVHVLHGPDYTVLLLTAHHLVCDDASVPLLTEALRKAYAGQRLQPADHSGPLSEFARRSREVSDTPAGDAHRAHWRRFLGTDLPRVPLPTGGDGRSVMYRADVPPALARRLRDRTRELGVSYFTALYAGYLVALRRRTGLDDLLVSVPFHSRTAPGLRDKVGCFVNMLPIRHRFKAQDSYADVLSRSGSEVKDCLTYGELPLPAVMRELGPTGSAAGERTWQTAFQYTTVGSGAGLDVQRPELVSGDDHCVLNPLDTESSAGFLPTLMVREDSTGTQVLWKDPLGLAGEAEARAMVSEYLDMLSEIAADPGRPIAPVPDAVSAPAGPERAEAGRASAVEPEQLRRMAEVWQQVLKKDEIKPDDSFFTLGGQSLMAGALVTAAGERFGVRIPLRTLFEHSRLGDFTEHVLGLAAPTAPIPDAVATDVPLAMTAFQQRIWLAELIDPSVRNHVPLAWRVEGRLDPGRLRVALGRLVAEHEILRTRFVDDDDALSVRLGQPWVPPLELLDLRNAPDGMMDWLDAALRLPFDLESGQLLRAALGDLGDGRQVLLLCLHHLVIDGESIPVLLAELDRHYTASDRPRPVVQYREFAAYQREQRDSEAWNTDLEYWASALEGAPADTPLPAPKQPEPNGAFRIPLPEGLLDSLGAVQSEHGVSWFMVAATALAVTLHRWTGLDDVTFGSPTANRNEPRFAELLGPCLNTAVLRSRVTADSTVLDALLRMRGEALGALEHQTVQFDDVITRLSPVRRFGHTPYVNVTLNMNLLDAHAAVLGGTRLTPVLDDSLRSENAKFGLTVTMAQRDGDLIGLVAHRGEQLGGEHARELAGELAALLARFPEALSEPVMRLG
ncbi:MULTISPECIES: condensation domain-containing protein [Streptomyces]|uniref:condensation domain-containing protein n=1 Tax=Streptomyces TaxID=1883 RepID=UPI00099B6ED0|nr:MULTISPECIES: condensation domain-containing protein [Streptomyces]